MGKSPVHGKLHRAERSTITAKKKEKYASKSRQRIQRKEKAEHDGLSRPAFLRRDVASYWSAQYTDLATKSFSVGINFLGTQIRMGGTDGIEDLNPPLSSHSA